MLRRSFYSTIRCTRNLWGASTSDDGQMMTSNELQDLVSCLPQEHVRSSFAYGSGVMRQSGNDSSDNLIDFVVVTDDAERFHTENLKSNSSHYSCLKYMGPSKVADIQRRYGASVYYNTLVPVKTADGTKRTIKYGVVDETDLIDDLSQWRHLYLAGRLQKPVVWVRPPSIPLTSALSTNHKSALHAALVLLPATFDRRQLYARITQHSYEGDVRMGIAEDTNKISSIVAGSYSRLDSLYYPMMCTMEELLLKGDEECVQDVSPMATYYHLTQMPSFLLNVMLANRHRVGHDAEDALIDMTYNMEDTKRRLCEALAHIVRQSSRSQTMKTALTAGMYKSIVYAGRKAKKFVKSKK